MLNRGPILKDTIRYTGQSKTYCRESSTHFIQTPSNESLRFRFGQRIVVFKTLLSAGEILTCALNWRVQLGQRDEHGD